MLFLAFLKLLSSNNHKMQCISVCGMSARWPWSYCRPPCTRDVFTSMILCYADLWPHMWWNTALPHPPYFPYFHLRILHWDGETTLDVPQGSLWKLVAWVKLNTAMSFQKHPWETEGVHWNTSTFSHAWVERSTCCVGFSANAAATTNSVAFRLIDTMDT